MEQLPVSSIDLIHFLDRVYPKYVPKPGDTMEDIMYKAGQRKVVDNLLSHLEEEQSDLGVSIAGTQVNPKEE